jgi:hypothetical protein
MSDTGMSQTEIMEVFGGEVQPVQVDSQELEVNLTLEHIRSQLVECMEKSNVGTVQLANRLHVHPSAVSRFLGGGGDMKVSTAVQYGRALGQTCAVTYTANPACAATGNYHSGATISGAGGGTLTSGAVIFLSFDSGSWPVMATLGVKND